MSSKLFSFKRTLPAPFSTVAKKVKVSSKYGNGTEATLSGTVVKGVLAYLGCRDATMTGAVGLRGGKGVAEYKSASGDYVYHLAVYDPAKGNVMASVYNKDTEMVEDYAVRDNQRDGAAVILAMMPFLMADEEFEENLDAFERCYRDGFTDLKTATDHLGILCDNAYRRVNDAKCTAHLPVNIDSSGNLMRISTTQLDAGNFKPDQVVAGEFSIFAAIGVPEKLEYAEAIPHSDFVGQYVLNPARTLSAHEQSLVPVLAPWYVLPEEVVSICKHAKLSTGKALPMRNFLLRGPAGTGKTEGARAIAAGLNLPYMKYTCSAGTEIYDLIGQVFPDTDGPSTGNPDLDQQRHGCVNYHQQFPFATLLYQCHLFLYDHPPAHVSDYVFHAGNATNRLFHQHPSICAYMSAYPFAELANGPPGSINIPPTFQKQFLTHDFQSFHLYRLCQYQKFGSYKYHPHPSLGSPPLNTPQIFYRHYKSLYELGTRHDILAGGWGEYSQPAQMTVHYHVKSHRTKLQQPYRANNHIRLYLYERANHLHRPRRVPATGLIFSCGRWVLARA